MPSVPTNSDPFAGLTEELLRRLLPHIERMLPDASPGTAPLLNKVAVAAKMLDVPKDYVYRMIRDGELVGYPFPDPDSDLHVETASIHALLRRRREQFEDNVRKSCY